MRRALRLYRSPGGLVTWWPSGPADVEVFRCVTAWRFLGFEPGSNRVRLESDRRGVVRLGPIALVRMCRRGFRGFRSRYDVLPFDLAGVEGPRAKKGRWGIVVNSERLGGPVRAIGWPRLRGDSFCLTTCPFRVKAFASRREAREWFDERGWELPAGITRVEIIRLGARPPRRPRAGSADPVFPSLAGGGADVPA